MKCLCLLRSKNSFDKINNKYREFIEFENLKTLEDFQDNIINKSYDFIILDFNFYAYHDALDFIKQNNLNYFIFKGDFLEINNRIDTLIENIKVEEKEKPQIQYVEKIKEVEKEVKVEVEVEKFRYRKIVISLSSAKKGIGSTHYSLCFSKFLSKDYKVALVEIGTNILSEHISSNDFDIFSFENLDNYYTNVEIRNNYDYIIIDFGYYQDNSFHKELFLSTDIKIFIFGSKSWELVSLQKFFVNIKDLKIIQDLDYVFNFAKKEDMELIRKDMFDLRTYQGLYCDDYNNLNKDMINLIQSILNKDIELDRPIQNNPSSSVTRFNLKTIKKLITRK